MVEFPVADWAKKKGWWKEAAASSAEGDKNHPTYLSPTIRASLATSPQRAITETTMSKGQDSKKEAKKKPAKTMKEKKEVKKAKKADKSH